LAEEEEESSEEGESLSFLHCKCSWIVDTDEHTSESGGIDSDNGSPGSQAVRGKDKGKEWHWATEEEEESSNESSKLVNVVQYKEASCKDGTSDACPFGSVEGWCTGPKDDSDGTDERGGHSPGPAPSHSPMDLSGCSSDFDLESGGVALALEDADPKQLEGWMDQEALAKALPKLAEKSHNSRLDLILCAHLTGMVRVLNLYLDPQLKSSWTNASMMVAKVEGHGMKHTCNL
jgi:hypothetical protein